MFNNELIVVDPNRSDSVVSRSDFFQKFVSDFTPRILSAFVFKFGSLFSFYKSEKRVPTDDGSCLSVNFYRYRLLKRPRRLRLTYHFILPFLVKLKVAINRHLAQHTKNLAVRGTRLSTVWTDLSETVLLSANLYFAVVIFISALFYWHLLLLHLSLGLLFVFAKNSAH